MGMRRKIISAHQGWNVVTRNRGGSLNRDPVLAWILLPTGVRSDVQVVPVIVQGNVSSSNVIFEKPDGSFVMPGNDSWQNESELLAYFEDLEMKRCTKKANWFRFQSPNSYVLL